MRRQAVLQQLVPPGLDWNILISNGAAESLRIFLRIKVHVFRLGTSQVKNFTNVRLRIEEQRGDDARNITHGDRRSLSFAKGQSDFVVFPNRFRSENQEKAFEK